VRLLVGDPLCGNQMKVEIKVNNNKIVDIKLTTSQKAWLSSLAELGLGGQAAKLSSS